MSTENHPAVSDAMRDAVARVTRAEVRACIGPTIPLRRRWVDLLMQGPIARLQAEIARLTGEKKSAEEAGVFFEREAWEQSCRAEAAEAEIARLRAERDAAVAKAENADLIAKNEWLRSEGLVERLRAAEAETAHLRAALEDLREVANDLAQLSVKEGDNKAAGALQFVSGFISDRFAALTSQEQADV